MESIRKDAQKKWKRENDAKEKPEAPSVTKQEATPVAVPRKSELVTPIKRFSIIKASDEPKKFVE